MKQWVLLGSFLLELSDKLLYTGFMSLKNKIRSFAAAKGMSLAGLADKIGQSRANLFKKLNNETIKYREMETIADALDKKIEWVDKNGD